MKRVSVNCGATWGPEKIEKQRKHFKKQGLKMPRFDENYKFEKIS